MPFAVADLRREADRLRHGLDELAIRARRVGQPDIGQREAGVLRRRLLVETPRIGRAQLLGEVAALQIERPRLLGRRRDRDLARRRCGLRDTLARWRRRSRAEPRPARAPAIRVQRMTEPPEIRLPWRLLQGRRGQQHHGSKASAGGTDRSKRGTGRPRVSRPVNERPRGLTLERFRTVASVHDNHSAFADRLHGSRAWHRPAPASTVSRSRQPGHGLQPGQDDAPLPSEQSGGTIEVTARDATDATSTNHIRMHLKHIAAAFAAGDFSLPLFVHDTTPAGRDGDERQAGADDVSLRRCGTRAGKWSSEQTIRRRWLRCTTFCASRFASTRPATR